MTTLVKRLALSAFINACMLGIAALIFANFLIQPAGFVVAVVLFTLLTVALKQVVLWVVKRFIRAYTVIGGLLLTAIALVLTDAIAPFGGFDIHGPWTWIGVTVFVWAGSIAYGEVDRTAPEPRPSSRR